MMNILAQTCGVSEMNDNAEEEEEENHSEDTFNEQYLPNISTLMKEMSINCSKAKITKIESAVAAEYLKRYPNNVRPLYEIAKDGEFIKSNSYRYKKKDKNWILEIIEKHRI